MTDLSLATDTVASTIPALGSYATIHGALAAVGTVPLDDVIGLDKIDDP